MPRNESFVRDNDILIAYIVQYVKVYYNCTLQFSLLVYILPVLFMLYKLNTI
jgi:hypothetical protein